MRQLLFTIRRIEALGSDVKQFEFVPADQNQRLWPHQPGAHIAVQTPVKTNCYSLTGDGTRPTSYRISVRRVGNHGGSAWLHDVAEAGDRLTVSAPTSAFAPTSSARHHLLIAAGIGVTPILSHARAARRWSRSFAVIYGHSAASAPHRDELAALAGRGYTETIGRDELRATVADALRRQPVGTHAYACGPPAFLDAFQESAAAAAWPEERVHVEHFTAPDLGPGEPFALRVAGEGTVVDVPAGRSALHALDAAGLSVPRLCERGVCGQCRTAVSAGIPEHRDLILSKREREANDCFYPCVSRALTPELEVVLP
jgi:ferredoxin-NADP reductase